MDNFNSTTGQNKSKEWVIIGMGWVYIITQQVKYRSLGVSQDTEL